MAEDLLREAARLCGFGDETPDDDLAPLDDEGFWLPRLLAACRARGWEVALDPQVAYHWTIYYNAECAAEDYDGGHGVARLVSAMLAAERRCAMGRIPSDEWMEYSGTAHWERILGAAEARALMAERRAAKAEAAELQHDSELTRVRNALTDAGVPEVEQYPAGSAATAWDEALQAGGRYLRPHERVARLAAECERLRSFVAECLPFLEEAWEACFRGQEQRMLSAEERGMGELLLRFRAVADGKPELPPGMMTTEEHGKSLMSAVEAWTRQWGPANDLRPELKRWLLLGDTCADGLMRANEEVERLRAELAASPTPEQHNSEVLRLVRAECAAWKSFLRNAVHIAAGVCGVDPAEWLPSGDDSADDWGTVLLRALLLAMDRPTPEQVAARMEDALVRHGFLTLECQRYEENGLLAAVREAMGVRHD